MILKYIKKKDKEMGETNEEKLIKVASLLVHAARIDDNYSEKEKLIILNFLKSYNNEK